ncbi:hypothetical protein [Cryptosporangium phraense]|uniref:Uncharacterized protein n=1 Tax=Cryptosporangium phraense TaxID=2593070 RepID=A0A545AWG7_9ACTN|nr:hypothetical protein [Cryptosporangium phraense]TQS45621.1 hypothetical protein FL583_07800 [Cryptosporangium phraense]
MAHLSEELRRTISARWYSSVLSERQSVTGQTRTRYYRALSTHLDHLEPFDDSTAQWSEARIDRADLATLAGAKATSTLYSLFGQRARSLAAHYAGSPYVARRHPGPVDALIFEAKAVSFWPCREAWASTLGALSRDDRQFAAETLVRVLAEWASANRPLAAVRRSAPPVCAVEDLRLVSPGDPPVGAVVALLTRVVELAHSPRGLSPLGTLDAVHDELMTLGFVRGEPLETLLTEVSEGLAAVEYLVPQLSTADRENLADHLVPQLRDVLLLLRGEK